MNESIPMVKKVLLKNLLQGKLSFKPELDKQFKELFKNLIMKRDKGCFSVIVFSIDEYKGLIKKDSFESPEIIMISIEALIIKIVSEYFICEPIDYESNCIYLLIKIEDMDFISSRNKSVLNKMQEDLQVTLNHKISCAIGMPVRSFEDIHLSYSNAVDIIKYRLVYGYGSFLSYDMEELYMKESIVSIDKSKDRLIQSIKTSDSEGVEEAVDCIINEISQCQYDYIMFTLNQLMLDIVKSVRSFYECDSNELDFNNIYGNLNSIGTLEGVKEFLTLYCKAAIEKIEKKRLNRKNDMINEMRGYIQAHYNEFDISTESLANMVNLTPGYFGKLFAENVGKTVNEYILELRFLKAQELLKSTSMTINEISLKIGFNNSTYFTTLFKKSFGVTPNQYRTDARLGEQKHI